jgi:hypothetical protein
MVSAFGETGILLFRPDWTELIRRRHADHFVTSQEPVSLAQKLAAFVKANSFDGVDIDFEGAGLPLSGNTGTDGRLDFDAMTAETAGPWLTSTCLPQTHIQSFQTT